MIGKISLVLALLLLIMAGCSDDDGTVPTDGGGPDSQVSQTDGGIIGDSTVAQDGGPVDSTPGPDTLCDPECTAFYEYYCVKVPPGTGPCKECLSEEHCLGNLRALGPKCDTANNFCVCASSADCVGRTTGSACNPFGDYMACGCNSEDDCTEPYTLCYGTLFPKCERPCTKNEDCREKGGFPGFCDTSTGQCLYE